MCNKQVIGKIGEEKACNFLTKRGDEILEKNFKCREGEIDIIAKDKNMELVFIEVKTRRSVTYGTPIEAIDINKKEHIYKVAKYYILKNKIYNEAIRFDAIEIILGETCFLHHIKQAF